MHGEDKAWNFGSRGALHAFCRTTFAEWTRCVPESRLDPFIEAVLDAGQVVAADPPAEADTVKFYPLELVLTAG